MYDITTINIHREFNQKSFQDRIKHFFNTERYCDQYLECKSYNGDASYAVKNLIQMGMKRIRVVMEVMHNHKVAHGIKSGNYIALWEDYLHDRDKKYHSTHYNVFFHELTHVHGFSHFSGMTYGYALYESLVLAYLPKSQIARRGNMITPRTLVKSQVIASENKVILDVSNIEGGEKNITIDVLSESPADYIVRYHPADEEQSNKVEFKFTRSISEPVYFRIREKATLMLMIIIRQ